MTRVLFVTWDGPHVPYLQALFLPIFSGLRRHGYRFHVLQFTWAPSDERDERRRAAAELDVEYTALPVLRRPVAPATAVMIAAGAAAVRAVARREGSDVVMPRSIVPAAMALAARRGAGRLVYEADGLAADERVDFAGWSAAGPSYRIFREIEAQAVRTADSVLARTESAKHILIHRAGAGIDPSKIHVVPNSKDRSLFAPGTAEDRARTRSEWGATDATPCIVFAGSIGPQYYPREMIAFYERVRQRRADARLVILTPQVEEVRSLLGRVGTPQGGIVVRSVRPDAVPAYLAAADLGLALRAPTFSQQAVCPIKVAEYLLCGVPVLSTPVGDALLHVGPDSGLVIAGPNPDALDDAAAWFVETVLPTREAFRAGCRETGVRLFDLDRAVERYAAALRPRSGTPSEG